MTITEVAALIEASQALSDWYWQAAIDTADDADELSHLKANAERCDAHYDRVLELLAGAYADYREVARRELKDALALERLSGRTDGGADHDVSATNALAALAQLEPDECDIEAGDDDEDDAAEVL
jgi:hypothetical protein